MAKNAKQKNRNQNLKGGDTKGKELLKAGGSELIGYTIEVYWDGEDDWFKGKVTKMDESHEEKDDNTGQVRCLLRMSDAVGVVGRVSTIPYVLAVGDKQLISGEALHMAVAYLMQLPTSNSREQWFVTARVCIPPNPTSWHRRPRLACSLVELTPRYQIVYLINTF